MYIRYAGDFLKDYKRIFEQHGKENYYGQKYSIETVLEQLDSGIEVLDLSLHVEKAYDEVIREKLRVVGLCGSPESVKKIIDRFMPDKVILRTPDVSLLQYLRHKKITTFPVFADSFNKKPWYRVRSTMNQYKLAKELNHKSIDWVANHQINASKSLMKFGISAAKILPYDWLHADVPENWTKQKMLDVAQQPIKLFYAGQISILKGIYDLVDAVSIIKAKGRTVSLKIAGKTNEHIEHVIEQKDLINEVALMGSVDHDVVLENMHQANAVIVPSHHNYPEGLPMTIMEGLMTNTPVIASDHPMFVGRCDKHGGVVFFEQKNGEQLAEKILNLMRNDDAYWAVQQNTAKEWHHLVLDLKFAEMLNAWITNPDNALLRKNSLDKKINT